jgi:hypothetical protein
MLFGQNIILGFTIAFLLKMLSKIYRGGLFPLTPQIPPAPLFASMSIPGVSTMRICEWLSHPSDNITPLLGVRLDWMHLITVSLEQCFSTWVTPKYFWVPPNIWPFHLLLFFIGTPSLLNFYSFIDLRSNI